MVKTGDNSLVNLTIRDLANKLGITRAEAYELLYSTEVVDWINDHSTVYPTYASSDVAELVIQNNRE
jgi:trans-aconitate methyltransferase